MGPNPMGPPWRAKYLELLRQTANAAYARSETPVTRAEVDALLNEDKSFVDDVGEALALFEYEQVERPIKERGVDGYERPIYWNGNVAGFERVYSDRLLLAMAKAHVERYRDSVKVDLPPGVGTGLGLDVGQMSPESQDQLRKIIEREMALKAEQEKKGKASRDRRAEDSD